MAHSMRNSSLASTPMTSVMNSSLLALHDETTLLNQESFRLVERFTIYITLLVSIVGLIGNACTIIVLNSVSMRKWRSSILLTALAVADFLYLSIIFLSIIDTLSNQAIGLHRSLILCQTTVYITHVCSFLSANFTLSFTLQRFVAVLFPLHANTIISSRSSTINILLLIIVGCSFYSLSFLLTNTRQGVCREDERNPSLFPFLIVDTCLTFVVPFIFIVIFNCAIVYKLRKRKKFEQIFGSVTTASNGQSRGSITQRAPATESKDFYEQQRLQPSNSTEQENEDPSPVKKKQAKRPLFSRVPTDFPRYSKRMTLPRASTMTIGNELTSVPSSSSSHNRQTISQRTTNMLVICSTTFLLFNSPYCAVLLYSIITNNFLTEVLDILRYFYFMSFCLNFFLYSLCGHRFRQELILLFKRGAKRCCSKTIYSQCSRLEKIPSRATV